MSASLVGSEMCIRDSSEGARSRPAPRTLSPGARVAIRPARRRCTAAHYGCLLYTSDAADDM
eukprot:11089469-Alexandrium_andersonii.AAC.1